MTTTIWEQAHALQEELVRLRRAIHQQPELGFHEQATARFIAATLQAHGLLVRTGVGRTGVVGTLGDGHPCIAIRADMDALPIQELNDVPYRSQVPGVMHACGHDTHVAMALGAAMLLARMPLPGQVRFLFQPSEERPDDAGRSGADVMVEDGALEGVDAVIALHVDPGMDTGTMAIAAGPIGAREETFHATIRGRGCHGADPEEGLDPIYLSSLAIHAIHGIVSRRIDPMESAVISIGIIQGGTESNIIPEEVRLVGTIRSFEEAVRQTLHDELRRAFEVVRALGGEYTLDISLACPAMVNDAAISDFIRRVGIDLLGEEHVQAGQAGMGAEDFCYMTQAVPGAMFGLGTQRGEMHPVHNPYFDIDEAALPVGTALLATCAARFMTSS